MRNRWLKRKLASKWYGLIPLALASQCTCNGYAMLTWVLMYTCLLLFSSIKWAFGVGWMWRFQFSVFKLFFFLRMNSKITWFYCARKKKCSCTVYILFTHLKIILLQYFQFSISATINLTQTDPKSFYVYYIEGDKFFSKTGLA